MNSATLTQATLSDLSATAVPATFLAPTHALPGTGRELDRRSRHALEVLAHAIEYLEDTTPFHHGPTPRSQANLAAIEILKQNNRLLHREIRQRSTEPMRAGRLLRALFHAG